MTQTRSCSWGSQVFLSSTSEIVPTPQGDRGYGGDYEIIGSIHRAKSTRGRSRSQRKRHQRGNSGGGRGIPAPGRSEGLDTGTLLDASSRTGSSTKADEMLRRRVQTRGRILDCIRKRLPETVDASPPTALVQNDTPVFFQVSSRSYKTRHAAPRHNNMRRGEYNPTLAWPPYPSRYRGPRGHLPSPRSPPSE